MGLTRFATIALAASLTSGTALAQATAPPAPSPAASSQAAPSPAAPSPVAPATPTSTPTSTLGDISAADFLREAANSDMFEVRSSQTALSKTHDAQVRNFAQHMIRDHTRADDELKAAAGSQPVPANPDAEHAQMLQQLQRLSGSRFTQAYLQMQATGHRQAIDLFQAYAQTGSDPGLKQYAQQMLPILRAHQELLGSIPGAPAGPHAQNGTPQFLTRETPDLWRASRLIGLNVYNQDGDKVGDIDDVLVDRNGDGQAVVIGVGGFLGIGEHEVAVPFSLLQWSMRAEGDRAAAGNTTAAGPNASATVDRAFPNHAVLPHASRDELRHMPEFHYAANR